MIQSWIRLNSPFILSCCCCCLPTAMTVDGGGSPMFPHVVHQPASPTIWPAVQSLRRGLSRGDNMVRMWEQLKRWGEWCVWVWVLQRGIVVMAVIWRWLCVNMIWVRMIYLLGVGQGCDQWGGEVSFQSCSCVVEVCAEISYCLLWLVGYKQ